MNEEFATLSGQLSSWPPKEELARVLTSAGLRVHIGRYSVRVEGCERSSFEQYGGDISQPCIVADAETTEKMITDSRLVSNALAAVGIRHRFEVYDGNDNLAAYFHHDWPDRR
ncbi:hypothetical protein [Niveibacterium microcysteis]|uniref:Uncharacterized protein n=1 Tax=Niveibacterium microcysteis TaxID=2811415 RepID=A0ABX7M679_9RHOO|nr:hypothetical protein [Niveibacterium microcysteis]QSI76653.1 hypothetical protein JY500_19680 [Niveibacterium microcysteis]